MVRYPTINLRGTEHLTVPPDDFLEIQSQFFGNRISASGYMSSPADASRHDPSRLNKIPDISVPSSATGIYRSETSPDMWNIRRRAAHLASGLFRATIHPDSLTLAPSVSQGTLLVLATLKNAITAQTLVETPAYFGTLLQSAQLHMSPTLLVTDPQKHHEMTLQDLYDLQSIYTSLILVLTQPKYGTGQHRSPSEVVRLIDNLRNTDYAILDEAADGSVPSALSCNIGPSLANHPNLFRVRGILKPIAANGLRVAIVHHHESWKTELDKTSQYLATQLDAYSSIFISEYAGNAEDIISLNYERDSIISQNCKTALQELGDTNMHIYTPQEGYFSAIQIPLPNGREQFWKDRNHLLKTAADNAIAIQLQSSMYFPCDFTFEHIRLNFLQEKEYFAYACKQLRSVLSSAFGI